MSQQLTPTETIEYFKRMSQWTNEIYDVQVDNLKRSALLVYSAKNVTLSIDTIKKEVHVEYQPTGMALFSDADAAYLRVVMTILGKEWTVKNATIATNEPGTTKKSRVPTKQTGTRSTKKAGKRSRK